MRKIYLFLLTLFCAVGASAQTTSVLIAPQSWTLVDQANYPTGLVFMEGTTDHSVSGHTVYKSEGSLTATGETVTITFSYLKGNHALAPMGVELIDDEGNLVSSDYHIGKVGGSLTNNVYTLSGLTAATTYTIRIYACNKGGDHQVDSHLGRIALSGATFNNETAPASGKFYRFKNYSKNGCLISGTSGRTKFGKSSLGSTEANSVFYLDGTKPVSFSTGLYLINSSKFLNYTNAIGSTGAVEFGFEKIFGASAYRISIANGRYLFAASVSSDDPIDSNAGPCTESGNTFQNYTFTVEEVTWLPVPMKVVADEGYATLYSPVQLGLGDGSARVEVYTVSSAAGTTATLSKQQTCVPANTGVILKYVKDLTNGCVYLPVQATTEENVRSLLRGSLADELVGDDAYVLSKPDNGTFGLYKATKNQDDNKWLNQGFRAYLPANRITGIGGARVLTFNFDDNAETGISAVEIEEAAPANAAIYDLSGRRVQSAKSGLYIINGKKVIK